MSRPKHPVDAHVGKRLRLRRSLMGWSQERLGTAIGLTFQQIQKYEKGTNRISCSRLYEFAHLLEVPPTYFFEDLPEDLVTLAGGGPHRKSALDTVLMATPEPVHRDTLELVRTFERLPDAEARNAAVRFVKTIVDGMLEMRGGKEAARKAKAG